jgi:hypothetical protein
MVDDEGAKKCKFTRKGKLTKYLPLNRYITIIYIYVVNVEINLRL